MGNCFVKVKISAKNSESTEWAKVTFSFSAISFHPEKNVILTFYFCDELWQVMLLQKGPEPFSPTTRGEDQSRAAKRQCWVVHSSWTLKRMGQQRAVELIFVVPSRWCLFLWMLVISSSSSHLSQKHRLFGSFSLFFWGRQWPGDAVYGFTATVGFHPLDVCSQDPHVSNSLFSLLSLLAPSPQNPGKLTSSRTGEIELYYFSFELHFTACLYLKAIIFYISWQEFSSTADP